MAGELSSFLNGPTRPRTRTRTHTCHRPRLGLPRHRRKLRTMSSTLTSCSIKAIFCKWRLFSSPSSSLPSPSPCPYQQLHLPPSFCRRQGLDQDFCDSPACFFFGSASFSLKKPRRNTIPVVVAGKENGDGRALFFVEPHILDHWLFQDLMEKSFNGSSRMQTMSSSVRLDMAERLHLARASGNYTQEQEEDHEEEGRDVEYRVCKRDSGSSINRSRTCGIVHGSKKRSRSDRFHPICLNCDAVLFEFFIWLVQNDDPSLHSLNLNDLMEFYD